MPDRPHLTETSTRRLPDGRVTPHYDPAMVREFINFPHDYDRWAQAGAAGWSYEEVAPVFRRIEHWDGAPDPARGAVDRPERTDSARLRCLPAGPESRLNRAEPCGFAVSRCGGR